MGESKSNTRDLRIFLVMMAVVLGVVAFSLIKLSNDSSTCNGMSCAGSSPQSNKRSSDNDKTAVKPTAKPKTLVDTGPGNFVSLFIVTTFLASLLHYNLLYKRRG